MLHFPRWQVFLIGFLCLIAPLFILPNFQKTAAYVPFENSINLGLDLQGGVHLAYQADTDSYFTTKMQSLKKDMRQILRPARDRKQVLIGYRNFKVTKDYIGFTLVKPELKSDALKRLETLIEPVEGTLDSNFTIASEGNQVKISLTDAYKKYLSNSILDQSIEVMRRRIDSFGTREPNILRQGRDKIIIQVPGESDIAQLKSEVGKTAQMTFHMVVDNLGKSKARTISYPLQEDATEKLTLEADPLLTGDNLVNAYLARDERGLPAVGFKFDRRGSQEFGKATSENIGRLFAIVLDNKIISAPRIQTAIFGGDGIITGDFTRQEAGNLALLLKSGALPVDLSIVEERTIGPELGAESIDAGTKSLLYGFCAVTLFMILFYGISGTFSVAALIVNVVMVFALLSMLSATLTLPGIAGIVLSIGVAVDANVLINERIREELRHGNAVMKAVSIGYEKAWLTIIDSHITGIVSAFVMFFLGSGPIRGFAVTLGIGILVSLFTSVWISRLLFSYYLKACHPKKLRFGLSGV